MSTLDKNHQEKCKREFGVFNFTDAVISTEQNSMLKKGKKFVIPFDMSRQEKISRISEECFSYAKKYRMYIENRKDKLGCQADPRTWLREASEAANEDEHKFFYTRLSKELADINLLLDQKSSTSVRKQDVETSLKFADSVGNECDKSQGMDLLPTSAMRKGEVDMVKSLGGSIYPGTEADLIKKIKGDIDDFYNCLEGRQSHLLDQYFGQYVLPEPDKIVVPFLHLKLKVHKMKQEDIKAKDLSKLKFGPIVDQSRWLFKYHSKVLRMLISSLSDELMEKYQEKLGEVLAKNGAEVASMVNSFPFKSDYSFKAMVSADLCDAYSETTLKDLEEAIEYAGEVTDLEPWLLELIISVARLIISNNFVETSQGLQSLTAVLAMGMGASPACLTLVGLVREHHKFMKKYVEPLSDNMKEVFNSAQIVPAQTNIKTYKRYIDDIHNILEADENTDLKDSLANIITVFLNSIPINLECSHMFSTFLDVVMIRKISTGKIETIMKKNMGAPVSFVHSSSSVPMKYKYSGLNGEVLRIRRICSKTNFNALHDKFLLREYIALGYRPQDHLNKRIRQIKEEYDYDFKKIASPDKEEGIVYGAVSIMEGKARTHQTVQKILKVSLQNPAIKLPLLVPGFKLGPMLHTRKRYLSTLRKDSN